MDLGGRGGRRLREFRNTTDDLDTSEGLSGGRPSASSIGASRRVDDRWQPVMTGESRLFPGAVEMMVLEALGRQPSHGYALVQHIRQTSQDLLQVDLWVFADARARA